MDLRRWSDRKTLRGLRWLLRAVCLDYPELCTRVAQDSKRPLRIRSSKSDLRQVHRPKDKEKKTKVEGKLQPIRNMLQKVRKSSSIRILVPGRPKDVANFLLLLVMLAVLFFHQLVGDPLKRYAHALVFGILLTCRLLIARQSDDRPEREDSREEQHINDQEKNKVKQS